MAKRRKKNGKRGELEGEEVENEGRESGTMDGRVKEEEEKDLKKKKKT